MKLKGTLKMERNTIVTLLIISISALGAGVIIEFGLQALLSTECFDGLHCDFITNVMLGIAGSATISLFCLVFPYLEKKNSQESKVLYLVRKVYCDYAKLIATILSNFAREETDDSYIGEFQAKRDTQQLSESIVQLCDQYGQIEVSSDGVDQIVAEADSIIALTEVVDHFLFHVMPDATDFESVEDEVLKKKKHFDIEENQELYLLLLIAMDDIISQDSMKNLFNKYISHNDALVVNLKRSTNDLLGAVRVKGISDKTVRARLKIGLEIMQTREKYFQKRTGPRAQVLARVQKLSEIAKGLSEDVAEKYHAEFSKIYDMMDYKGCTAALDRTKQLEKELSQIYSN